MPKESEEAKVKPFGGPNLVPDQQPTVGDVAANSLVLPYVQLLLGFVGPIVAAYVADKWNPGN
jgi:hypothetical protein